MGAKELVPSGYVVPVLTSTGPVVTGRGQCLCSDHTPNTSCLSQPSLERDLPRSTLPALQKLYTRPRKDTSPNSNRPRRGHCARLPSVQVTRASPVPGLPLTWASQELEQLHGQPPQPPASPSVSSRELQLAHGARKGRMAVLTSYPRRTARWNASSWRGITLRIPCRQSTEWGTLIVLLLFLIVSMSSLSQITTGRPCNQGQR